jgi:hypothetical protein
MARVLDISPAYGDSYSGILGVDGALLTGVFGTLFGVGFAREPTNLSILAMCCD